MEDKISKLIKRINSAKRSKSKELRIDMEFADGLLEELTEITNKLNEKLFLY